MATGFPPALLVLKILALASVCAGFYVQPEPVTFYQSPGNLAVLENSAFTLTCVLRLSSALDNLPHPLIQWLRNGAMITENPGMGIISTIPNNTAIVSQFRVSSSSWSQHAGHYQCLAQDGMDSSFCRSSEPHPCVGTGTLSGSGKVYVLTRNGSQEDIGIVQYQSTRLRCGSEFGAAPPTSVGVVWKKNGQNLNNTPAEFLLMDRDIMLHFQEIPDSPIRYDCYVSTEMNLVLYRSYDVTVNYAESGGYSGPQTQVSVHTPTPAVEELGIIQLACSVAAGNRSDDEDDVLWTKAGGDVVSGGVSYLGVRVLNLEGVGSEDAGSYCCVVREHLSCTARLEVYATVSHSLDPVPMFINFRNQISHSVTINCSIPQGIPLVTWFRNGVELENQTNPVLTRTSDDPYQLYGVYQCSAARQYRVSLMGGVYSVARVLPYGITNPVRGPDHHQFIYPLSLSSISVDVLLWWEPPLYRGNLSLLSYKVLNNSFTSAVHSATSIQLSFQMYSFTRVRVIATHPVLGEVSSSQLKAIYSDGDCNLRALYPPVITNITCLTGVVEVHYKFDSTSNAKFSFNQKNYFFHGGCRDEKNQEIYRISYSRSNTSLLSLQNGVAFQAGVWCTVKASNVLASAPTACQNARFLLYSDFSNCYVGATVGFEFAEYIVNETSEHVQVCLRSEGYGFNLTVSGISTNPEVISLDEAAFEFSSANSARKCVSVSVNDDVILGTNETLTVAIATNNSYVVMETDVAIVTVVENEVASVGFLRDYQVVLESDGWVESCVALEMRLRNRNVSAHIDISGSGTEHFSMGSVTFTPNATRIKCISIATGNDNVLKEDRNWTLTLSSDDPVVRTTLKSQVVQVLEDDSVLVKFDRDSYMVEATSENFTACISVHGELGKNISVSVTTENEAVREVHFSPATLTHCLLITTPFLYHISNDTSPAILYLNISTSSAGVRSESSVVRLTFDEPTPATAGVSITVWSMVGVSIAVLLIGVAIVIVLIVGSRWFMERLKEQERVIDANFRRRPLMEPYGKVPPNSWPDPVALSSISPISLVEEDTQSEICTLDYKFHTTASVAISSSNRSSVVGALSPMESSSSVGVDSLSMKRSQLLGPNDNSSSTLGEYINPFDNAPKNLQLDSTLEESGDSGIPSVLLWESAADQEREGSLCSPRLPSLQTVEEQDLAENNPIPSRGGTKPVDQDSGFSMQDTSGFSLDMAEPLSWLSSHSSSREDVKFHDCDSGFHTKCDSSVVNEKTCSSDMESDLECWKEFHSNSKTSVDFDSKPDAELPSDIQSTTAV